MPYRTRPLPLGVPVLEHALSVAAAKAKIAGLVVAAAAVGGTAAVTVSGPSSFLPTGSDTAVTSTASPDPAADVTPAAATVAPPADVTPVAPAAPAVTTATSTCPAGLKNHGAYVSSVAHDKTMVGRAHGAAVSAAAKSTCGKKATDGTAAPEPADTEKADAPETPDAPDAATSTDGSAPAQPKSHTSKGHGKH